MLLAHKKDLQQKLRLSILTIEDKELSFYFQNMQRIGTIAAFLSLFIFGAFFGRDPPQDDVDNNPIIVYSFLTVNMTALLLECHVVFRTMELCIRGPGLGLRGPEGSMTRAVFIMRNESKIVHRIFYLGLVFYHISTALYLYVLFQMDLILPIPSLRQQCVSSVISRRLKLVYAARNFNNGVGTTKGQRPQQLQHGF